MPDFTPKTKRLIVGSLGILGFTVTIGWIMGAIEGKDALLVISAITTGFMALLKGVE